MRETKFWGVDTCGCHINFQFDDADLDPIFTYATQAEAEEIRRERHAWFCAEYERIGDAFQLAGRMRWWAIQEAMVPTICPDHAMLAEGNSLLDTLFNENRRKNLAVNMIQVGNAGLAEELIVWRFTGTGTDRVLHLQYPHVADGDLTFQAQMDLQFGPGKVVLE